MKKNAISIAAFSSLSEPCTDWDGVAAWLERSWLAVAPARLAKIMRVADDF